MKLPQFTKKDKRSHAEKILDEKIDAFIDDAKQPDEIMQGQRMLKNRQEYENDKKKTILGCSPETVFVGVVSLAQIGAIIKAEDLKVLTSKAMSFVHKGRLR